MVKLLDFWAAWCGPCKIMNPIIEEIEKEFVGKIVIEKVDVDAAENQQKVQDYQVGAMPTYIIEANGEVVEQFIGAQPKSTLVKALNHALENN
ncbi:MAG: thioredoxin [Candidatus Berkelbacteria bacterium]|nr:MAG: thioredoxin [Candidatus Berkelbacteria bacterium]QQG51418.1 MAG: thioredoxin [Candidatus Berkelbacteria bacterium]